MHRRRPEQAPLVLLLGCHALVLSSPAEIGIFSWGSDIEQTCCRHSAAGMMLCKCHSESR